jgi:hypothetical protein
MTATFFTIDGGAYLTTQSYDEMRKSIAGPASRSLRGWVEMVPSGTLVNLAHVVAIEWGPGEESPNTIEVEGETVPYVRRTKTDSRIGKFTQATHPDAEPLPNWRGRTGG